MKRLLSLALALLLLAALALPAAAAETDRFGEPETVALAIGGDAIKTGGGFLKNIVWLTPDDLDAIAAAPSGESTYRLGLGDSFSELLTYSTFENHGVPVYGWRRVYGLDLKLLAEALGVDTAQSMSITALSGDGMSKTLPDAFGADTARYSFDPAGKIVSKINPVLALFETSAETEEQSAGVYPAAPVLGAESADRVAPVFGYGQTEPTEVTACFWVKDVVRVRLGAESVALTVTAGGKTVTSPLSGIVRLGAWDARFGSVRALGAPVTELLAALGVSVPEGKALRAASADDTEKVLTDISALFAAWQASDGGSGVKNATALRLYWDGGELADLVSLTVCDAPEEPETVFTDLAGYDWAVEAAEGLYARGVVRGDGTGRFLPGENLRRGDFVLMLARAFDLRSEETDPGFADVDKNAYYAPALAAARALGIARGDGDKFYPHAPITRQEALTLLHRALTAGGKELSGRDALDGFADAGSVADWAADAIAALAAAGVVRGDGTHLNPAAPITRAEMAAALWRAVKAVRSV